MPLICQFRVADRSWGGLGGDGSAVHQPDINLTGDRMAPEDIGLTVSIEVADPDNLPIQVTDGTLGRPGRR